MSLKTLPVEPDERGGDQVQAAYLTERNEISSEEELLLFIVRWGPLYEMALGRVLVPSPGESEPVSLRKSRTQEEYNKLVTPEKVPLKETWACIQVLRTGSACEHSENFSCCGMHVMVPLPLMEAVITAEHYGVPTDLALIQLNGGFGALYE